MSPAHLRCPHRALALAVALVGTLVAIGMGHLAPEDAAALLHTGGRIPRVKTAPAHGLFLEKVFYD